MVNKLISQPTKGRVSIDRSASRHANQIQTKFQGFKEFERLGNQRLGSLHQSDRTERRDNVRLKMA